MYIAKYSNFIVIGQVFCYNVSNMNHSKNKSFTLIEVLIVIIIIGILASLILFSTQDAYEKVDKLEILNFSNSHKGQILQYLVSEWTFDGSTPAGTTATSNNVEDSWKYNNGTITGDPQVREGDDCVSGSCLEFDGSDYINYGQGAGNSLKITGSQTFEMWLYPTDFTARRNPMAKAYGGEGTITQETNKYLTYYYGTYGGNSSPYQGVGSGKALIASEWNYIAIVRDLTPSVMKVTWFVNGDQGTSIGATYSPAIASANNFYLGTGYCSPYIGRMDEVRIYNGPFSLADAEHNYIAGLNSLLQSGAISKEEYSQRTSNLAKND